MDADLEASGRGAPQALIAARHSDVGSPTCTLDWLALREPADAAARCADLVNLVNRPPTVPAAPEDAYVIADLGSGSGSMGRWLAPRLPGAQHWVLYDRDAALLGAARLPDVSDDGAPVTVETRVADVAALSVADLAGVWLVTASALLDTLMVEEVNALAAACVDAGVPALLTLTVTGGARLRPTGPEDPAFAAAFDAHQRRRHDGLALLGPDAGDTAVTAFTRRGATVHTRPSPWRLGAERPGGAALLEEWLRGWLAAACEQQPELEPAAGPYLRRRLEELSAGVLHAEVDHVDVLAVPA